MKKIYLSKNSINEDELQKMIRDLEEQGYEVIISYYNEKYDTDLKDVLKDCEIVLVLIDGNCDEDVDTEIESAVLCGRRVVGVYASGAGEEDIPHSLNKMGSGVIPFDIEKIDKIVQGDNSGWLTPEGVSREKNIDSDRSEC